MEKVKLKDQKIESQIKNINKKHEEHIVQKQLKATQIKNVINRNNSFNSKIYFEKINKIEQKADMKKTKLELEDFNKTNLIDYMKNKNEQKLNTAKKNKSELINNDLKKRKEFSLKLDNCLEKASEKHNFYKNKPNKNELLSLNMFGKTRLIDIIPTKIKSYNENSNGYLSERSKNRNSTN